MTGVSLVREAIHLPRRDQMERWGLGPDDLNRFLDELAVPVESDDNVATAPAPERIVAAAESAGPISSTAYLAEVHDHHDFYRHFHEV